MDSKKDIIYCYLGLMGQGKSRLFVCFFILVALLSCREHASRTQNPYLSDLSFSLEIDTSFPLYSDINFASNTIYVEGAGSRGVYIFNNGSNYMAWEASCPNHYPNDCSKMILVKTFNLKCLCDGFEYSMVNGAIINNDGKGDKYSLLGYNVTTAGSLIYVTN